jgi:flavodoxin
MNVLVTYLSGSGNTERVARAIYDGIGGNKELLPMGEVESLEGYDLVFVGFPIIGRGAPRKARKFLHQHANGKKVALFITHGMPGSMEMLRPMLDSCVASAGGAELQGMLDCQGRLAGWMSKVMRVYPNAEVRKWVRAGGESIGIGHPSKEDLDKAREFAAGLVNRQGQPIVG